MAVTQYIGSRYVPLFADPAEWSSEKSYEPLTIVLHEGNSYTSKQAVPVGVDIGNGKYWVETGNYNQQVEQYRRETAAALEAAENAQNKSEDVQNDINTLLPKTAFDSENTVKKYIDDNIKEFDDIIEVSNSANSGFNPINLLIDKTLTNFVGKLPDGYVYQGMTIIDEFIYIVGYPAVNRNSTLFKINRNTLEVANAYDFSIYIHGNSVTTYNNLILVCDTTRGYYTFNTDLELLNYYNPYAYQTPIFRNASFCVFSDNIHAMSQISGHAGANVFYKDCAGIFTSYNLVKNDAIGTYGYQDMCQCFNLVAMLCSYANDNKIFLFKYDGTCYMTIPFPALDIEFEGMWFDNSTRLFHIIGADGSYYTFNCINFLSSNKTNITQLNDSLYEKNDYWRAPVNNQGIEFGDIVRCTNTDGTKTVYMQRYIRKPNFANTGSNILSWQLNTGAFLGGSQTGGGAIRANIPIFNALHGAFFLGLNYANAPTADRQGLNTIYVYDGTQVEPKIRIPNLNNMTDEEFIEAMKPFVDYMISTGILTTSANMFGAIRPANNMQGDPDICYVKLLEQ